MARLTIIKRIAPRVPILRAREEPVARAIARPVVGLQIQIQLSPGRRNEADRIVDHCPVRAEMINAAEGKIHTRFQLSRVAANASAADEIQTKTPVAQASVSHARGNAATIAVAG
ncbi:MAG: hypothetical protein Q7S20_03645 [Gemmatimonadaceae bacterium]|nr:hypothetical protein [Gemmatimonadaceae bacterium]